MPVGNAENGDSLFLITSVPQSESSDVLMMMMVVVVVVVVAKDLGVRVRFSALPDFLRSSGSLEQGPLSLVSTTEEALGRKSSGSVLESRVYGRRDPSR
jgi:hypothetical protein